MDTQNAGTTEQKKNEVIDISTRAVGTEIIQLQPEDLILDTNTDVRPWESTQTAEEESRRIESLAKTIQDEGQLQPVLAREITDAETGAITYSLIAGRRRTAAIALINDRHRKDGSPLRMPVNVSVLRGVSDDSAFRKAMLENAQRLQMSPMDMAMNVVAIRTRMGWEEKKDWSKRVADFLGTSRAFVTQKVKLFELPAEMQAKIHSGDMSEEAAWVAIKVKPEHREAVVAKAEEIAAAEAATGTAPVESTGGVEGEPETVATDPAATATPGQVTQSHVLAAARGTEGALEKAIPLNRKELIQSFEQFDASPYGHKNGAVRKFVTYFVDTYAKGTGTPTMFKRLFNAVVKDADQGTPEPEKEKAAKPAAKGKAAPAAPAKAKKAAPATEAA